MNRDPIEEKGGLNLYAIVGNNTVNHLDVLGEASMEISAFNKEVASFSNKVDKATGIDPFIELVKDLIKVAKKGKVPCFCMSSVEGALCKCLKKNKTKPRELAKCVCLTSPAPVRNCEARFVKIWELLLKKRPYFK